MTTNGHHEEAETSDPSYIDYELFLDPDFSSPDFANTLVLSTNNPTDTPLDLSTPLSRVLFDIQEVDSHIHTLTAASALPLLSHTQTQTTASSRINTELTSQVGSLNDSYKRLEKEIIGRYEAAEEVQRVSERLWQTVRLGRAVGRALQLGRQLEVQMAELSGSSTSTAKDPKVREDYRAMVRASNTILTLRQLFEASAPGEEGESLSRVAAVQALRNDLIMPSERLIRNRALQTVREFSMSTLSGNTTYAQTEDTKSRTTSAVLTLYLLSPVLKTGRTFVPELMVSSLQEYLKTSITSSLASLVRALGTLPTLDRTLLEISARCQNIVALSLLLDSIKPPPHPLISQNVTAAATAAETPVIIMPTNLLHPVLASLETGSLPSYFWRTLASNLSPRVQDLMNKGGVQARTLRSKKTEVRDSIRECVVRGSQPPAGVSGGKGTAAIMGESKKEGWEREVAVMAGAVIGHLGR
jgi:hypothetical protein